MQNYWKVWFSRGAGAAALLIALTGCTTIPQRELQAYRKAFDEARAQSENVLADHAAARHLKSNLVAQAAHRADPAAAGRSLAERLGIASFDADVSAAPDDITVRLKAWTVVSTYNDALSAVAAGASKADVEGAVGGFLGALQKFPVAEVTEMAGEVVPYAGAISALLAIVQKEVEARRFRNAVLMAEEPMKKFVQLLRNDAILFRNYRVTLLNQRFREQEISIFDRADRFRIVTSAHGWNPPAEVNGLINQVNSYRVLAAGVETFPPLPAVTEAAAPAAAEQGPKAVELRTLSDSIEREAGAARATVTELGAYHELMRQYTLLINELERSIDALNSAAHQASGQLPSIDQLEQVISNVRLAHQIYRENK